MKKKKIVTKKDFVKKIISLEKKKIVFQINNDKQIWLRKNVVTKEIFVREKNLSNIFVSKQNW